MCKTLTIKRATQKDLIANQRGAFVGPQRPHKNKKAYKRSKQIHHE